MIHLLLAVIYVSFISLGLPDSLLGAAWPSIYQGFGVPVSYSGVIFCIISVGTVLSSLQSEMCIRDSLYADGSLNRRLLADRAFAAPEGKAALDSLVLPEIIRRVCRLTVSYTHLLRWADLCGRSASGWSRPAPCWTLPPKRF